MGTVRRARRGWFQPMAENPWEIVGKLWKTPGKTMETPRKRSGSGVIQPTNHEFKGIHGKTVADFDDLGCGPTVPGIGSVVFVICESRRHKYHMSFHISIHPTVVLHPFPQWEASPLPSIHHGPTEQCSF